jgi:sugar transferase (PEP-CTERM system associated)
VKLFNRYYSPYDFLLLLGDLFIAALTGSAMRAAIYFSSGSADTESALWVVQIGIPVVLIAVSFYYTDLYEIDQAFSAREWAFRLLNGFGVACLILGVTSYLLPAWGLQHIYVSEMAFLGLGLLVWRVGFARMLKKAKTHVKVLIVGAHAIGKLVAEELCRQKHLGMEVIGFIGSPAGEITLSYGNPTRLSLPVFPCHSTLGIVEANGVNRILVDGAESCADFPAQEPLLLRAKGIQFEDCHTFYERLKSKIAIADLKPEWLILSNGFRRPRWLLFTKRVIDTVFSVLGLILSSPIALITAIAIKLDSPGPILYWQERVGQNEKPFTLLKFRSMVQGAESKSGPVWASPQDSRVTRVGRVTRKLRIDEIPQMINVLKGEMSFVGPRPERPFFVSKLKEKVPYYHLRFSVKPGMTGWAQICYSYGDSEEDAIEKLQYDLYYMKNLSPIFDLQILLETVKVVLLAKGAQ